MNDNKFRLSGASALPLPRADADRLIAAGDGDAALLYLCALRSGGEFSASQAERELGFDARRASAAEAALRKLGLLDRSVSVAAPSGEPPEYTAGEIATRAESDDGFRAVVDEAQRVLGRMLSGSELRILFGIYSYLGLPTGVILLLLNHCAEETRRRYGERRTPSLKSIEIEAARWADRELLTTELAEEYLERLRLRDSAMETTLGLLQIKGRALAPTERKYLESWLEQGFTPDALEIAYDRTVTNTGSLKWKYMDSIVRRWHEAGLHTADEINSGDRRPGQRRRDEREGAVRLSAETDDLDRARKILDKARKG